MAEKRVINRKGWSGGGEEGVGGRNAPTWNLVWLQACRALRRAAGLTTWRCPLPHTLLSSAAKLRNSSTSAATTALPCTTEKICKAFIPVSGGKWQVGTGRRHAPDSKYTLQCPGVDLMLLTQSLRCNTPILSCRGRVHPQQETENQTEKHREVQESCSSDANLLTAICLIKPHLNGVDTSAPGAMTPQLVQL